MIKAHPLQWATQTNQPAKHMFNINAASVAMMVHSGGIASIATAIKPHYSAMHIPKSEEPKITCMVVFNISFNEVARYSGNLAIYEVLNKPKYPIIQDLAVPI
jgi:hypothetical protein